MTFNHLGHVFSLGYFLKYALLFIVYPQECYDKHEWMEMASQELTSTLYVVYLVFSKYQWYLLNYLEKMFTFRKLYTCKMA